MEKNDTPQPKPGVPVTEAAAAMGDPEEHADKIYKRVQDRLRDNNSN